MRLKPFADIRLEQMQVRPWPCSNSPFLPRRGRRVQGAGWRVEGVGCRVEGAGCRVQGGGCRVQGAGCRPLRVVQKPPLNFTRHAVLLSAGFPHRRSQPLSAHNQHIAIRSALALSVCRRE